MLCGVLRINSGEIFVAIVMVVLMTMIGVVKVMTWVAAVVLRRTINSEIEITDSRGIMVLLGSITTVTNRIICDE